MDHKRLSESQGQTCVLVRQRMSRSFEATISASRGPLFLMDLVFNTHSVRGPGLREPSLPNNSNNISPLPLTKFENL